MMKLSSIPELLAKEFIYGAHLSALISPSLVISLQILFNLPINIVNLVIVYILTLIVYSYNYQKELDRDFDTNSVKVAYLKDREKYYPYIMGSYILALAGLFLLAQDFGFIIFIVLLLIGGLLYTIIFKVLTRKVPAFKSLYITTFYAYAATFFIAYCYSVKIDILILIMFMIVFIKMFIAVVFFDIKDMNSDSKDHLKTIPNLIGKNNTLLLLTLLNIIHLGLVFYCIYLDIFPIFAIGFLVLFFYTEYYIIRAVNADQKKLLWYSYVLVDGEFALWVIILLLSKTLYYGLLQ